MNINLSGTTEDCAVNDWMNDWLKLTKGVSSSSGLTNIPFPTILPIAQTVGLNLTPLTPPKTKAEIRQEKMKSIFENSLKRKILGRIKRFYKKFIRLFKKNKHGASLIGDELISVKPMSAPTGQLVYMDYKYSVDKKAKNKKRLKKLNRIFKDLENEK